MWVDTGATSNANTIDNTILTDNINNIKIEQLCSKADNFLVKILNFVGSYTTR